MSQTLEQQNTSPRKIEALDAGGARSFVEKNMIPAHNSRCCIDGRYPHGDVPACARPGGDPGYFMEILAGLRKIGFNLNSQNAQAVLDTIIDTLGGPTKIDWHTDEHSNGVAGGCKHIANARNNPNDYGLTGGDAELIEQTLLRLKSQGGNEIVLKGEHKERAVLILNSRDLSINHQGEDGDQVFVYHKAIDQEQRDILVQAVSARFGLDNAELLEATNTASANQLEATADVVAKNLPRYIASRVDGELMVVQL